MMNDYRFPADEAIDQEELDRLVDGELGEAAYRSLLARMEDAFAQGNGQPWRQCALAMLEAQALRRELKGVIAEPPSRGIANVERRPRKQVLRWTGTVLACAASFAAAFVLAAGLKSVWMQQTPQPDVVVSGSPSSETDPIVPEEIPQVVETPVQQSVPSDGPPSSWEAAGNLTLAVNTGDEGGEQRVEVPIYHAIDGQVPPVWTNSSAAPAALLEALENAGHRVTRRQHFWPLKLDDGREVIVPVEQLTVAPASMESIQ